MKNISHTKKFIFKKISTRFLLYLLAISLAISFLFPVFWSFLTSFKPPVEAAASPATYFPTQITFSNYLKLDEFGAGVFQYIANSGSAAVLTVIGTVLLSLLGGFGFSRFHFAGKNVLFVLILVTLMIPFQSILIPLFLILRIINLNNSILGLSLVYITFQLPFGIFMMRNTFDAIPKELEEAALLDGCTPLTLLYRVMLGLVKPGLITVAIYAFINAWNEFLAALIFMSREDQFTLPVMLAVVRNGLYGSIDWGALQAGVSVSIIPCVIIFLLLQRNYMEGLMSGATKG